MEFSLPSDQIVIVFPDIPTGSTVGVQIQDAVSGLTEVGRTLSGVTERPAGSGNYVFVGAAPSSQGDYLVIADWNAGVIDPATSDVRELKVTSSVPVSTSGLGAIADATKSHLAGIFDKLINSPSYGQTLVVGQIETVKARLLKIPPTTGDEDMLNPVIIDYLGKLVALALIPAAIALLQDEIQSRSTGNEPLETVTFVDKIKTLDMLQNILLEQIAREEALVLTLLADPVTSSFADTGPAISDTRDRVTADPGSYPTYGNYPFHHHHPHGSVFG